MRRIWVSAAALTAGVSFVGWMAASSAEDRARVNALAASSLFDDAPNPVRAVEAPAGTPSTAVVQAKSTPQGTGADSSLPPPETTWAEEAEPKVVWRKPWTWFARKPKKVVVLDDGQQPSARNMDSPAPMRTDTGLAFDSPARVIRSGMGQCLKTGTWVPNGLTDECGNPLPQATADSKVAAPSAVAISTAAEVQPAGLPSAATARAAPVEPAASSEPVIVEPMAVEPDDHRKALDEKDNFETLITHTSQAAFPETESVATQPAAPMAKGADELDLPINLSAEALFGFKSSKLLWGGQKQLDKLAERLKSSDYESVLVVGHTDRVGTVERNKKLSLRRAQAVKDYLAKKGVPSSRISIDGRGSEQALTDPQQCEGLPMVARRACQAPDRRVEVVITRALAKKNKDNVAESGTPPGS